MLIIKFLNALFLVFSMNILETRKVSSRCGSISTFSKLQICVILSTFSESVWSKFDISQWLFLLNKSNVPKGEE